MYGFSINVTAGHYHQRQEALHKGSELGKGMLIMLILFNALKLTCMTSCGVPCIISPKLGSRAMDPQLSGREKF